MGWFSKKVPISPGPNPQLYPGENVMNKPPPVMVKVPGVLTDGFNDSEEQQAHLHYTERAQPDLGGALNFSYDLYQLPLVEPAGPWMVARHPTKPLGSFPTAFFQEAVVTSIGGLIPGQFIHQPLLDPNAPGSGFDYGW